MTTVYRGIALGGRKGSGKDTVLDYLRLTRNDIEVVRCKQPIVDKYLQLRNFETLANYVKVPRDMSRPDNEYIKSRDDADLIWFSTNVIRDPGLGDPFICSKYLNKMIPEAIERGKIPVVPDMRRVEENDTLFKDLHASGYPILCMKLEAPMQVLMDRTARRDGDLRNWHPEDATEAEVDELKYHYIVTNDRDEMRPLVQQLETILYRHPQLRRTRSIAADTTHFVRVVDAHDELFWSTGMLLSNDDPGTALVSIADQPENIHRRFLRTALIPADGGCLS